MGLREFGHPVQGLHPGRDPPQPGGEDRGRGRSAPVDRLAPSVALHIPWDRVDDFDKLRRLASDLGVRIGTINTNTFQDDDYKLGSLTHSDDRIRAKAIAHMLECVDIMDEVGSRDLKIWLPDGTNYPGQADLKDRQERLTDSLRQVYGRLGAHQRLVLEYKLFEPAFYATDVPDWGTAYVHCVALGERAVVCLDTGHHAPGTNIEFIVMQLLRLGRLGSFDFNSRFYADDDLMVGAADPFQLFRILYEVVRGADSTSRAASCSCSTSATTSRRRSPRQIRSVLNVQEMPARALLVDRPRWPRPSGPATCSGQRGRWTPSTLTSGPTSPSGAGPGVAGRPASGVRASGTRADRLRARRGTPPAGAPEAAPPTRCCWPGRTVSGPTPGTPTTAAGTPRPRGQRGTRSPEPTWSCCG